MGRMEHMKNFVGHFPTTALHMLCIRNRLEVEMEPFYKKILVISLPNTMKTVPVEEILTSDLVIVETLEKIFYEGLVYKTYVSKKDRWGLSGRDFTREEIINLVFLNKNTEIIFFGELNFPK